MIYRSIFSLLSVSKPSYDFIFSAWIFDLIILCILPLCLCIARFEERINYQDFSNRKSISKILYYLLFLLK